MAQTQTFVVTGGNTGLGYECARALVADPRNLVVIACRDPDRGNEAARQLQSIGGAAQILPLDLASLASVRNFADLYRRAGLPPLAGLVCNAGIQNVAAPVRTADGHESTFAVNHLAHYLLVRLLLPMMRDGGHIVFVSSGTHDPDEKTGLPAPRYTRTAELAADFETGVGAGRRRYTTSKLCNIYCTYELARRLSGANDSRLRTIRVSALDPGLMPGTGLARTYPAVLRFAWHYVMPVATLFRRNVHRVAKSGARLAALVADQASPTGKYYSDGSEKRSSALSYDEKNALELWNASSEMAGLPQAIV